MNVLIDIGHPAHVHFFKNLIKNLKKNGHSIQLIARDKEVTLALLQAYGFECIKRGELHKSLIKKALGIFSIDYTIYKIAKKFKPDIIALGYDQFIFTYIYSLSIILSFSFSFAF